MKLKLALVLATSMLFISAPLFAEGMRQIPLLFNFQSALVDEGGNLLPDGSTALTFRVLDSAGTALYEESQDLEIVKGQVSAIVGNGVNSASGAATGGIPADIFDPTDARYLQVEAVGHKPYDNLEIVTAPYALWADTALKVAPGAITGDMIGNGAITKENLNDELISAIFPNGIPKEMLPSDTAYTGDFTNFSNTIQSTAGASKVGVNSSFIYSGSQTVQGVLKDLDLAVKKRQEEVEFAKKDYGTKVTDETAARIAADAKETSERSAADISEATTRYNWDKSLQDQISSHKNSSIVHGSDGTVVGKNTLNSSIASHAGLTTTHGSSGAIVGVGTLNSSIANHSGLTATHGVSSVIVGASDSQTLSNKILVAPTITGGTNVNPGINADLSVAANEGVVVDGNLKVTGNITGNITGKVGGYDVSALVNKYTNGEFTGPDAAKTIDCGFAPKIISLYAPSQGPAEGIGQVISTNIVVGVGINPSQVISLGTTIGVAVSGTSFTIPNGTWFNSKDKTTYWACSGI